MKRYAVLFLMAMMVLVIPTSAQAKTLKLSYIERETLSASRFVDADNSGTNGAPTSGDYFVGASNLYAIKAHNKPGKRVGKVTFKVIFSEVTQTTYKMRLTAKATLPGGHVYVDNTQTGKVSEDEGPSQMGDVERYPIKRGDGRYKGYTGSVTITVLKPGDDQQTPEISRDVFKLKK